jgi:hypothetical protein
LQSIQLKNPQQLGGKKKRKKKKNSILRNKLLPPKIIKGDHEGENKCPIPLHDFWEDHPTN